MIEYLCQKFFSAKENDMKKVFAGVVSGALTVAMVMGLAGCGGGSALAQARSIQGEEVSEEQWVAALTQVGEAELVGIAEGDAEAANFSVGYEVDVDMDVTVEEQRVGDTVIFEGGSMSVDMNVSATVVTADHKTRITMTYDMKMDGSEAMLEDLGGTAVDQSGSVEVYTSYENGQVALYAKVNDGDWNTVSGSLDALEGVADSVIQALDTLTEALGEVSVYASRFGDFTYSAEDKGHVYNSESDMGVGSVVGDVGGKLIIKIRDGKLAAVLQEASLDASISGMTMTGSAGMGMVYTVGGQSVTLPEV